MCRKIIRFIVFCINCNQIDVSVLSVKLAQYVAIGILARIPNHFLPLFPEYGSLYYNLSDQ